MDAAALLAASAATVVVATEMIARRLWRVRPFPWLPESPLALAALPLIALAVLLVAHALSARAAGRWRGRVVSASVFAALFAAGVALQLQLGARLQSDGFYYFAYLRSLAFDRDVEFHERLPDARPRRQDAPVPADAAPATRSRRGRSARRSSGRRSSPAATSSPTRLAAHGRRRQPPTASRFPTGRRSASPGLFYGLLGCWFTYRG